MFVLDPRLPRAGHFLISAPWRCVTPAALGAGVGNLAASRDTPEYFRRWPHLDKREVETAERGQVSVPHALQILVQLLGGLCALSCVQATFHW